MISSKPLRTGITEVPNWAAKPLPTSFDHPEVPATNPVRSKGSREF